jgi:hypothetical protein
VFADSVRATLKAFECRPKFAAPEFEPVDYICQIETKRLFGSEAVAKQCARFTTTGKGSIRWMLHELDLHTSIHVLPGYRRVSVFAMYGLEA